VPVLLIGSAHFISFSVSIAILSKIADDDDDDDDDDNDVRLACDGCR